MTTEEKTITIDFNDLTLGDLEDFEERTGVKMNSLSGKSISDFELSTLITLVWLIRRHDEPELTYEQARATTRIGDIDFQGETADPS